MEAIPRGKLTQFQNSYHSGQNHSDFLVSAFSLYIGLLGTGRIEKKGMAKTEHFMWQGLEEKLEMGKE